MKLETMQFKGSSALFCNEVFPGFHQWLKFGKSCFLCLHNALSMQSCHDDFCNTNPISSSWIWDVHLKESWQSRCELAWHLPQSTMSRTDLILFSVTTEAKLPYYRIWGVTLPQILSDRGRSIQGCNSDDHQVTVRIRTYLASNDNFLFCSLFV